MVRPAQLENCVLQGSPRWPYPATVLVGCSTFRALRLGKPQPDVATSDALCRTAGAGARAPPLAFAAASSRLSSGEATTCGARTPKSATRLEVTHSLSPGRLPSTRCSTLRASEALRVPCDVRAKVLAPFRPTRSKTHLRLDEPPRRATSHRLGCGLSANLDAAKKMLLADLCNRLTTRAPVNRSISRRAACAAQDRRVPSRPRSGSPVRRQTVSRRSDPG